MENFTYPGEKAEKGAERQIDVEGFTKLFQIFGTKNLT